VCVAGYFWNFVGGLGILIDRDHPFQKIVGRSLPAIDQKNLHSRCWWKNSAKHLNMVLTIEYFDRLGTPRLV
jgi:hypothetical protein